MQIISESSQVTKQWASEFVQKNLKSNVVALIGELGSGKTTFVQGLGKALGIKEKITSPTFLLLKSYPIANHPQFNNLIHVDLYRIYSWDEVSELDLEELWKEPTNLVVIEWAERINGHLPENIQEIAFEHLDENERIIVENS